MSAGRSRTLVVCFSRHYAGASVAGFYSRQQDFAVQRELFIDVLNANVTRRDAKQFLANFKPVKVPAKKKNAETELSTLQRAQEAHLHDRIDGLDPVGVDLDSRYGPTEERTMDHRQMHLALVCFKAPETLDHVTLDGIAVTISQLGKLGLRIVIVLEPDTFENISGAIGGRDGKATKTLQSIFAEQAARLCRAIEKHSSKGARSVSSAFEWVKPNFAEEKSPNSSPIAVAIPDQILHPLERGIVLIVPSMAYTASGRPVSASSLDVMAGLTRDLAFPHRTASVQNRTEVDRVIIIDPVGGIPCKDRGNGTHVVINLEQHLDSVEQELSKEYSDKSATKPLSSGAASCSGQHRNNLDMIRRCLALLPPASSGLILTPAAAANSSLARTSQELTSGNGVRQTNVLIHNLLTNKPMISSSLPAARLPSPGNGADCTSRAALPSATLVKRGMSLAVIPADQANGWQPATNGKSLLDLEDDPRIEFPRLVHLINDSFRRSLDINDYLARIRNRVAGVIVAGEYEGAAIFTWEMPPNTQDPARLVPYLDKFAVAQSSQGSSGVADILFQAMVETCFPSGLCWRSRKTNPANKWYFERSAGSWRIPKSGWTMFWTGEGVLSNNRWKDYIGVCTSVRQSWADSKRPA
ncbi:hypothetical protein LTR85_012212 [Meristemomyces frigidus]|nr:hypothetical protein LTR85_012212 [Meristemomyces frigidus]